MLIREMETVIIDHGLPLQLILHAALVLEETTTLGASCSLGQGSGRNGDPAHMLDRALSLTRHIRDGEHQRLRRWIETSDVEPQRWPRMVLFFWSRVPMQAARDVARVAGHIV